MNALIIFGGGHLLFMIGLCWYCNHKKAGVPADLEDRCSAGVINVESVDAISCETPYFSDATQNSYANEGEVLPAQFALQGHGEVLRFMENEPGSLAYSRGVKAMNFAIVDDFGGCVMDIPSLPSQEDMIYDTSKRLPGVNDTEGEGGRVKAASQDKVLD